MENIHDIARDASRLSDARNSRSQRNSRMKMLYLNVNSFFVLYFLNILAWMSAVFTKLFFFWKIRVNSVGEWWKCVCYLEYMMYIIQILRASTLWGMKASLKILSKNIPCLDISHKTRTPTNKSVFSQKKLKERTLS